MSEPDEIDAYLLERNPFIATNYIAIDPVFSDKRYACIWQVEKHLTCTFYAETPEVAEKQARDQHLKRGRDIILRHGSLPAYLKHLDDVAAAKAKASAAKKTKEPRS